MNQSTIVQKLLLTFLLALGFPATINSNGLLTGYFEITSKYYPKTVAYFEKLQIQYPVLKDIPIAILGGPFSDDDTIYFPMEWIEELEKENKFYLQTTEWIILHEAGHIIHHDVIKEAIAIYGILAAWIIYFSNTVMSWSNTNSYNNFLDSSATFKIENPINHVLIGHNLKSNLEKTKNVIWAAAAAGISIYAIKTYMLGTREYAADDFAMQHCNNPQAWIAACEYLDRFSPLGILPGIFHSFTKYRLERISKAFQEKFGYELVIVPQSLNPEYVTE